VRRAAGTRSSSRSSLRRWPRERPTRRAAPTSIISIIALVGRAAPDERRLLLDASVIGRTFWRSLLRCSIPRSSSTAPRRPGGPRLHPARAVSVLEGDDAYSFRHMSLREVAHNMLPKAERRERHAAVARLAEARSRTVDCVDADPAYHWREAGDAAAIDAYLRAASRPTRHGRRSKRPHYSRCRASCPTATSGSAPSACDCARAGVDRPHPVRRCPASERPRVAGELAGLTQVGKSAGDTSPPIS
jgi:hypothetical protein